jgi:sister-chromatid-cohesion protein PDS5
MPSWFVGPARVLMKPLNRGTPATQDNDDDNEEWTSDDAFDESTRACIAGLKVLTNRTVAYADSEDADNVSTPVFRLLWSILDRRGTIDKVRRRRVWFGYVKSSSKPELPTHATFYSAMATARLRLQAALSILKLATVEKYDRTITRNFQLLAWTMQDASWAVRNGFLEKLISYLYRGKLKSPRYNILLFLLAHDPDNENVDKVGLFWPPWFTVVVRSAFFPPGQSICDQQSTEFASR